MQTLSNFGPKGFPSSLKQKRMESSNSLTVSNLMLFDAACRIRRRSLPPLFATPCTAEESTSELSTNQILTLENAADCYATEGENLGKTVKLNVRALAHSLWESKSADDVELVLGEYKAIHPRVYSSMIKGLGFDNKLDAAFALIEWLKRERLDGKRNSVLNTIIYNSLLGAIRQSGAYARADRVIEDMEAEGIIPNVITYNSLMHIFIDRGDPDEAWSLLESMKGRGISPSAATFSIALMAYQKSGDGTGALGFFLELRGAFERGEIGRSGDGEDWEVEFVKLQNFAISICYHTIRQWLVKGGDDQICRILQLLADMDMAGLSGGRAELEKLSWACTREAHHVVAREIYTRIRDLDSGISLSVCNHIIWLMGKAKKWWAALEIYEDLLDRGPKPNNLSYELIVSHFNVLLSAARKRGIWRWGLRLLEKMQEKGLKPRAREWNAVLVACSKASETCAGVQIFKRMIESGEKPTIVSYGALLSALEKGELYDEALRVWDHMIKMGIQPNLYAYTILNCIHIGNGSPELVESVIRDMDSSGIEPTVVTFNAIISGCARKNHGGAALEWYHRMKVRNIAPNDVTYEMLIQALTREGKPRIACEVYLKAQKEGFRLSAKAYDAVVQSSVCYGTSFDLGILGPRPPRMKNSVNAGTKTLSEEPRSLKQTSSFIC